MKLQSTRTLSQPISNRLHKGFTTVELLVGLLLSLFIIGVSITYFIASSQTFKLHTNESVVQENGRFALEYLASSLRHAGVNPGNSIGYEMDVVYTGSLCSSSEAGLEDGTASTSACTRDGAKNSTQNNSDRVALDYVIDASKEISDLVTTGCNGHSITVPAGQQLRVASVLWTADLDADGVRSLYCQTLNLQTNLAEGAALPLVDGVERLQIQFGLDSDGNGIVEQYLSYANLGAANSDKVKSMRVAVLVISDLYENEANTETASTSREFKLLDAASESFANDKSFRQVYATTVMVHNAPVEAFAATP